MATHKRIEYRSGYKYQLAKEYKQRIDIRPRELIVSSYIILTEEGDLTVEVGYAWDGPSGPVIDTTHNMRASLVHDALYQLMREGWLNLTTHRRKADKMFELMCVEDGVSTALARAFYYGLRAGGYPSARPESLKRIRKAP